MNVDSWHRDIVSGKVDCHLRKLGSLIDSLKANDVLIVTEVSRLSRKLIDVMNIVNSCIERKVTLHCIKEGFIFENDINSKILGFAFGLVSEIERNLISARTKEALAIKRAAGVILGRPAGSSPKSKILHQNKENIILMLSESVPHRTIALKYKVSICTLARFLRSHINTSA